MTTVHTYLYQSWTIGNDYETIRCVIKRLAAVEQRHYAIIGQLIALLGGEPECRSTMNNSYWCGNMINYSCDLRTLLSNNAKSECFAAQAYESRRKSRIPAFQKCSHACRLMKSFTFKYSMIFYSRFNCPSLFCRLRLNNNFFSFLIFL
ncbi:MAG: hypothetical protein ACLVLH_03580 [Eisenbergiella massiliensis]